MKNKTNNSILYVGVKARNSKFNADWEGLPRQDSNGNYFASPMALKYTVRNFWRMQGEKVFGLVDYKNVKGKFNPKLLKDKIADVGLGDKSGTEEVLETMLDFIDLKTFGIVLTKPVTLGISGVVQVMMGMNTYEDTVTEMLKVGSPNSSKEGNEQTTLGDTYFTDFAMYNYPVVVQPNKYNEINESFGTEIGYTDEDYAKLKDGLWYGSGNLNTLAKSGCSTSYLVEVELKEGEILPNNIAENLVKTNLSTDEDGFDLITLDFTRLQKYLDSKASKIKSTKLYYEGFNQEVIGWTGEKEVM